MMRELRGCQAVPKAKKHRVVQKQKGGGVGSRDGCLCFRRGLFPASIGTRHMQRKGPPEEFVHPLAQAFVFSFLAEVVVVKARGRADRAFQSKMLTSDPWLIRNFGFARGGGGPRGERGGVGAGSPQPSKAGIVKFQA